MSDDVTQSNGEKQDALQTKRRSNVAMAAKVLAVMLVIAMVIAGIIIVVWLTTGYNTLVFQVNTALYCY